MNLNIKKIIVYVIINIIFFLFVGCSSKNELGGYKPTKKMVDVSENYDEGLYLFMPDQYAFDFSDESLKCVLGDETQEEHEKNHVFDDAWINIVNKLDQSNYLATNPKAPVYVFLNDNQQIEFENGILYPIDVAPKVDYDREVMLQVGRDIEAGLYGIYKLSIESSPGYQVVSLEEMMSGKAYPGYSIYSTADLMKGYSNPTKVVKVKELPASVELEDGDFILLDKYTSIKKLIK